MTSNVKMLVMRDPINKYKVDKKLLGDLPMRAIFLAGSGQGKTLNLSLMVIDPLDQFYGQNFKGENIYVFSGSLKTDHKIQKMIEAKEIPEENVFDEYDDSALELIYDMIEDKIALAKEEGEDPEHSLIILDDVFYSSKVFEKRNNMLKKIYLNGRKNLISIISIVQSYANLPTAVRENTNLFLCFNMSTRQLELVQADWNYLDSKRGFMEMIRDNCKERYDFVVFNMTNKLSQMYLDKNWNVIDTSKYSKKALKAKDKEAKAKIEEENKE